MGWEDWDLYLVSEEEEAVEEAVGVMRTEEEDSADWEDLEGSDSYSVNNKNSPNVSILLNGKTYTRAAHWHNARSLSS